MPRLVIVNADDLGYDPAITRGILRAASEGIVTSTTLLVNTPFSADAAAQARAVPSLAVGLHFNLARGEPLSGAASLKGPGGELSEERAAKAHPDRVEAELLAQLARFTALVGRAPTHLDSHKHLHRHPNVLIAVLKVASERKLPVRSIDERMRAPMKKLRVPTPDAFVGDAGEKAYWSADLLCRALDEAGEGVTELMCHPGFLPERVRTGYAAQREAELAALTDPAVVRRAAQGEPRLATFEWLRSGLPPGGQ
jgi:predicted glycoside hydrolase/deacetylase ChbG (UPF0249 family)